MSPISPLKTEPLHGPPPPSGGATGTSGLLDSHWAVAAIDIQDRARALAAAQRLWSERHGPGATGDPDMPAISVLATAYDVAALDCLDPFVRRAVGNGSAQAGSPTIESLQIPLIAAAARTFQLRRVLPISSGGEAGLFAVLHVAALATVADRRADLADWLRAGDAMRALRASDDAPWDVVLCDRLAHVWVDLLAPARGGYRRAINRVGALREDRDAGEAALLDGLSDEQAVATRFRLFTLYHVADAAAALITYLSSSEPVDILRRLSLHFTVARAAAAGDATIDVALSWLHGAAVVLAQRRTEQLPLPGISQ